jgi:membrane associated rhomboid family serine protease
VLPRYRRGAFALFALTFVVTLLLGDRGFAEALTLEPGAVLDGSEWWTPLTTMFRYPEGLGLLGLLGMFGVQWLIGSRLEGFWGTARYLAMVLVAGLLGYASTLALALALPDAQTLSFAGASPLNLAAAVAFMIVFGQAPKSEPVKMQLGSAELSPVLVGGIVAGLALGFPLVVALVAKVPVSAAWPTLVPGGVAGLVAVVFVQPWHKRKDSGKVAAGKARAQTHLRVVRTPEDMLN